MTLLPTRSMGQPEIDLYNRWMTWEYEKIRDFLILHYHATERDDTPYWDHCRTMEVSDYLKEKIAIFRSTGRVFREHDELFNDTSWFAVMMGQGLTPGRYDPIVDEMPEPVFLDRMSQIRRAIRNSVDWMPDHFDFIAKHCAGEGFTRP
jgi:tryptophan halogenase